MVVIAAAVLSGILYGLPGIPFVYRLVSALFVAAATFLLVKQSRGKSKMPLLFYSAFCILFFAVGFVRAETETKRFNLDSDFYEKYEGTNPGVFDYAEYLKSVNVTTEEQRKALKTRNRELETPGRALANDLKEGCGEILDRYFTEKDAGIIKAMLLGEKQEMDSELKSLYQESGIAHLLAVSGLHVSMVGAGSAFLLRRGTSAGRKAVSVLSAAAVLLYSYFTGASVSSLRAAIMFCFGAAALFAGRKKDLASSLGSALICLLIYRPYAVKQSGFQLSFLAICGIIYSSSLSAKWEKGKGIASCLGVTLFTMPVVAYSYYQVPLYSVLLNLAVIPLMAVVFLSGITVLFAGAMIQKIGNFLIGVSHAAGIAQILTVAASTPAHLVLKLYSLLSEISLQLPFAEILTGRPTHYQIILYYFLLLFAWLLISSEKDSRKAVIYLFACYLSAFPILCYRERNECYITVLDVGQGDCFHIHDHDTDILIDCGSSGYERAGSQILENYLLAKKINDLDLILVSHADADHINGILYLYSEDSQITPGCLGLPALAQWDEKYVRLKEAAKENCVYNRKGDLYTTDSVRLRCVFCEEDKAVLSDTNRESSVWYLEAGDFSMLFTGDITEKEEIKIVSEGFLENRKTVVLKCAHHGSDTANSKLFVDEADPDMAVLSYGKNNRYGHPSDTVSEMLKERKIRVLTTEKCGAVTFLIKGSGYEIKSFKTIK